MSKYKYYNIKDTITSYPDCQYYMIVGQRSNGKSYSTLRYCVEQYFKNGSEFAIVRRWAEDFKGKRAQSFFDGLVLNGEIENLSGGKWTSVYYWSGRWYMAKKDAKGDLKKDDRPFAYSFALTEMQHDKSSSFNLIRNIVFDEFLVPSGGFYIPNEVVTFWNTLSTIVRDRSDCKVLMLANTTNPYNPYAEEFGLTNFKNMKPGDVDIYSYGKEDDDERLKVCVEFCEGSSKNNKKKSDVFFAFDNPQLNMIKGTESVWEISIYPRLPFKYNPKDIMFTYFIKFDKSIYQAEIIKHDNNLITYIHRKTGEIKNPDKDLVFSPEYDTRPNHERYITKPQSKLAKNVVAVLGNMQNVYYQDNMTGLSIDNYFNWCKTEK